MKLAPIIDRLKTEAPLFGGRVSGASEYAEEVEATRLVMPCAYVVRGTVYADEAAALGAAVQVVTEEFGIAVAVDNSTDKRGQKAEEQLDDIRYELIHALVAWVPPSSPSGDYNAFDFVGEQTLELNRGRVWRLFMFRTSTPIQEFYKYG